MKHILLFLTLCGPLFAAAQKVDLESMPKEERDRVLIAMAKEAVLRIGPDYYREDYPPLVEEIDRPDKSMQAAYERGGIRDTTKRRRISTPMRTSNGVEYIEVKFLEQTLHPGPNFKGISESPVMWMFLSEGKNYIVTFLYDHQKEILNSDFAARVIIPAKEGIPVAIEWGDFSGYGIKRWSPENGQHEYRALIGRKGLVNAIEVYKKKIDEEMRQVEAKQAVEIKNKKVIVRRLKVQTVYDSTFLQQPPRE